MREKTAAHQVKTVVGEGKSQRIGDKAPMSRMQVGGKAVEVGNLERDFPSQQLHPGSTRDFAKSGGNFEQRKAFLPGVSRDSLDHAACGRDTAEPAVDPAQITQRGRSVGRRTLIGIENLLRVNS